MAGETARDAKRSDTPDRDSCAAWVAYLEQHWRWERTRVIGNVRRPLTSILALLGSVLASSTVLADDYRVDFGIKTKTGEDARTITCQFGEMCGEAVASLGLRISILVFRSHPERASVYVNGSDLSCCYFVGAADSLDVDTRQPLSRVGFFQGARARGALFIENKPMGTLFLRFSLFRDHL